MFATMCVASTLRGAVAAAVAFCFSQSIAADSQVIIGVVGPITTSSKAFGIGHLQGITLAVDQYNRSRPTGLPEVILNLYDDQSDRRMSADAVRNLIQANAVAVLGPCNSRCAEEIISQVLPSTPIPVVSALATRSDLISVDHSGFFFRANMPDKRRVESILKILIGSKGFRRVIALYESPDAYGDGLEMDVENWLKANNPTILTNSFLKISYHGNLSIDEAKACLQQALNQGYNKDTDACLILGLDADGVTFANAAQKCAFTAPIFMPEPNQLMFQKAAAEGIRVENVHTFNVWNPNAGQHNKLTDAFETKFGEETTYASALAYDAATMVLDALAYTWIHNHETVSSPEKFRDALRTNLISGAHGLALDADDYALTGIDRSFRPTREFSRISLAELRYGKSGRLQPWNAETDKIINDEPQPGAIRNPGDLLRWLMFVCLWLCGLAGSTVREFHAAEAVDINVLLRKPTFWVKSLFLDPLIATLCFLAIFMFLWFTNSGFSGRSPASVSQVMIIGAVIVGFFAGFLGIRSIYAVLKKFGIDSSIA